MKLWEAFLMLVVLVLLFVVILPNVTALSGMTGIPSVADLLTMAR